MGMSWQSMEEVAFRFNLHQSEMVESKTSFEFVRRKNLPIPF